jgi:hypothetical protein
VWTVYFELEKDYQEKLRIWNERMYGELPSGHKTSNVPVPASDPDTPPE